MDKFEVAIRNNLAGSHRRVYRKLKHAHLLHLQLGLHVVVEGREQLDLADFAGVALEVDRQLDVVHHTVRLLVLVHFDGWHR